MLTNRLKILKVYPNIFIDVCKYGVSKPIKVINPIPDDAMVVRMYQEGEFGTINIVIASKSFPELKDGEIIPEIEKPLFEQING